MIKFAVFADYHYKKGAYISSVASLEAILKRAADSHVDFVIHLGDFCNDYKNSAEVVELYVNNPYGLSVYGVYGNHELEAGNEMALVDTKLCNRPVAKADGERIGYWTTDIGAFRLIGLDTNYSQSPDGVWERNADGTHLPSSGNVGQDSLGCDQLVWLRETVADASARGMKVLVFSHAAFSGDRKASPDAASAREIFHDYPDTVLLAVNGHLHTDHFAVIDNVAYFGVNVVHNGGVKKIKDFHYDESMTYEFQNYANGKPVGEVQMLPINTVRQAKNTWFFREPLSAIVTVTEDGEITIDGARTSWVYDIEPDWTNEGMIPMIRDRKVKLSVR